MRTIALACLLTSWGTAGASLPPVAPGGPHSIMFAGDNLGGYPPLLPTTDVPGQGEPSIAFAASVSPNPVHGSARFALLGATGPAHVAVYSIAGRRVCAWRLPGGASVRSLDWDLRDARGRPVPPGLYFWRAESGGALIRGKLAVVR